MAEIADAILPIDLQLRFALFGLECALAESLDGVECERVFRDAAEDQVSAKQYLLFESTRLVVSARVGEYEPDLVRLRVQGERGTAELVKRIIENSAFHALRRRQSMESDKCD